MVKKYTVTLLCYDRCLICVCVIYGFIARLSIARTCFVRVLSGVGLNQFQTSSPKHQRKAAFNVSLLSSGAGDGDAGASASPDDHSPKHHKTSSQSSASENFIF